MEQKGDMQVDEDSTEVTASNTFTFSRPNVVFSPPKVVNFGLGSEHVFDAGTKSIFTFAFASPTAVSQQNVQEESMPQSHISKKQYKPKISRNAFKPTVNVFAQALKETAVFEQLKKNSRSQAAKINVENSITCSNVPQSLLTKVTAKEYFTMFGTLMKIAIRPKKQIITVTYATKEEANNAYYKSGEYLGEQFNVEWTKSCLPPKSPTKKKDLQKNIVSNFLKAPDEEIKSELDAMMSLEYLHSNVKDTTEKTPPKRSRALHSKSVSKSAQRMEKAGAKTEKHKSDSQISDLLPNASMEELQNIIRQVASTSEDKYKVLEARDRLMRLKQVKLHTLANKVMSGTCPDMCPEKERLMRDAKRQVALYEQVESSEYRINHAKAVKQYSRSSADQEEPMAHELRPVKSLKMTMSYLLHEIANLCDQPGTNLGEWYHFLWDRTRGIRKDITQQELCCTDSVELVEQCARFHIVCSERLCAEELSVFDKKINSDNLTKCLQSLKYMYHDLRMKGITCKNEPEFRAYIILLNLNNGNFMWDLQRLPTSIQKSPEVRFAIDVYSAIEANNYYKFFKLVRKTTYLNACILLRYFNQVRLKALSVMVKAYCRTASTAYPLYELIDVLGFEDENEAIYFCDQLGLNASKDELHVLLNRQNFTMPVLNLKQGRACNLIECKRTTLQLSIGQCIVGGKMPEQTYKYHKPHNSFDSNGYLLPESINAEDQSTATPKKVDPYEFIDEDVKKTQKPLWTPEKSPVKTQATVTTMQTSVFKPVTTSEPSINVFATIKPEPDFSFISKPSVQNINASKPQTSMVLKPNIDKPFDSRISIFNTKPQDQASTVSKHSEASAFGGPFNAAPIASKPLNVFSKPIETLQSNDASPFAMATNKSIFSGNAQGNIFARNAIPSTIFMSSHSNVQITSKPSSTTSITVDNKSKGLQSFLTPREQSQKPMQGATDAEKLKLEELERAKKIQRINENAEQILNDLQVEVVHECCSNIVREDINRIETRNALSEEINDQILNEVTHEICRSILTEEIINKQRLYEMSVKIKNRVILKYFNKWKQHIHKKKQQRKALDNTPVWLQKHSIDECAKLLYSKEQDIVIQNMCKRRDLQEITKFHVNSLAPIEVIIYAGIKENLKSLDIDMSPNFYWKLVIAWPDLQNRAILCHHKKIMNQYLCPNSYTMDPIIKLYRPNQIETLHICIRHFEGFTSDHNLIGSDALLFIAAASEEIKSVARRLTKTVLSRHKLMPIPLVFIVLGDSNLETRNKEIVSDLEALLEAGYLSEYTIMHEKHLTEKSVLNLTQSAILWLAINRSPPNPLEMDYLQDVYDVCLTEELWLRILGDSPFNAKLSQALKEPNFVINLHNEAVTHLMDIILDPESFMYTKFAPEFKKFLKNQYMIPCSYEFFDDAWKGEDYKAKIENIMSSFVLPQWKYSWPISNIDELRQNVTHYCQEALSDSNSNLISFNILSNFFLTSGSSIVSNFVDILLYIVKEKIRLLEEDLKVIYNKNHIKHFRTLPWWFKSNVLTEYSVRSEESNTKQTRKENDTNETNLKKRRLYKSKENVSESESTLNELEPLAAFCENTRNKIMEVHHTSKEIEDRFKAHQQQSSLFEEQLRNALLGDELISNDV